MSCIRKQTSDDPQEGVGGGERVPLHQDGGQEDRERRSGDRGKREGGGTTVMDALREEGGWSITRPRIFDLLASTNGTILVAGCGGGYDILSGLPLYFALTGEGRKVVLANFSFTHLQAKTNSLYCDGCVRVTHNMKLLGSHRPQSYFPELYLAQWMKERCGVDVPVYAFDRSCGVIPTSRAYQKIVTEHSVGAIVLVDGGTDSLMFGFEEEMGTPTEDQTSIMAVSAVEGVAVKILACIGFGVDSYHGVSHGLFLENVATIERAGSYLGAFSVPQASIEGRLYMEGYKHVSGCMQPSIVSSSITDAMQGHFGNYHSTRRTGSSPLFINPLMPLYWTFQLSAVVDQIPYARKLLETHTVGDVLRVIGMHAQRAGEDGKLRKPLPLPM